MQPKRILRRGFLAAALGLTLFSGPAGSQQSIPFVLSHQGRIALNDGENFDGTGYFKFSLLTDDSPPLWRNDGSNAENGVPLRAVPLPVTKGLYSVLLGDPQLDGMTEIPPSAFAHPRVFLRTWFSADGQTFELLQPDQRIAAVGYAMVAKDVPDGAITSSKIADGAVHSSKLADDAIDLAQLSPQLRASIEALLAWQSTQLPLITSPTEVQLSTDLPFSYQITAGGSPSSFGATGLPPGLSFNSTSGLITGTVTSFSDFTFNVTATNLAGTTIPVPVSVDVFAPVFVDATTGDDRNFGTMALPRETIQAGIERAASLSPIRSVRVSTAAHTVRDPIVLADGVMVLGGFNRRNGWSPGGQTPLERRSSLGQEATYSTIKAHQLSRPMKLEGFAITTRNAVAPGASSVGIWCVNATDLELSNNTITSGNGSDGRSGTAGGPPTNGADGQDGGVAEGYVFAGGGCLLINGHWICGNGDGGVGAFNIGLSGNRWATDGGGPNGGSRGASHESAPLPGESGGHGSDGNDGDVGAVADAIGNMSMDYLPAAGGDGRNGEEGEQGGGGGGGGGIIADHPWGGRIVEPGGGGGEGGGGGSGGKAGTGGTGGGGSFGILATNSTVAVRDCTFTLGNGGDGGAGGNGNAGGIGGFRGVGSFPTTGGAHGGNGGAGGTGGAGGPGAGGPGGPSIGILLRVDSTLSVNSNNTFNLGTGGSGGAGGTQGALPPRRAPDGPAGMVTNVLGGIPAP